MLTVNANEVFPDQDDVVLNFPYKSVNQPILYGTLFLVIPKVKLIHNNNNNLLLPLHNFVKMYLTNLFALTPIINSVSSLMLSGFH